MKRLLPLLAILFASSLCALPPVGGINRTTLLPDCAPSPPSGACPAQNYICWDTSTSAIKRCTTPNIWASVSGSGGSGDVNATYITQTASSTLTAEQPLSSLDSPRSLGWNGSTISGLECTADLLCVAGDFYNELGPTYDGLMVLGPLVSFNPVAYNTATFKNDIWGTGRVRLITHDSQTVNAVIAATLSDTPSNGQTLKWNTGGAITWEDDLNTGSPAFSSVTDGIATSKTFTVGTGSVLTTADNGSIVATTGDTAASFWSAGTCEHERGCLEADVSAYNGLVRIAAGATSNVTNLAGLNTALGSSIADGAHTTDTNANTICSGTTTYLDGEGNCDNIASTYADVAGDTYTGTHDFKGSGSIILPWATNPTTDEDGECVFDENAWATGRDALECWDGTASTYLIGVLASDAPSDGQVPTWNTGGTITWETGVGGGGGAITDLDDVTITSVATGEFLGYAGAEWEEWSLPAGVGLTASAGGSAGSRTLTFAAPGALLVRARIEAPAVEALNDFGFAAADGTVVGWKCKTDTGTATLNVEVEDGTMANLGTADCVCASTLTTCTVNNGGYTAGTLFDIDISATSGTPGYVSVFVW